jgi:hypothetical protein
VQLPSVTELSMLRSLTKLAAYIGNNELDWRRTGASVVVSTQETRANPLLCARIINSTMQCCSAVLLGRARGS